MFSSHSAIATPSIIPSDTGHMNDCNYIVTETSQLNELRRRGAHACSFSMGLGKRMYIKHYEIFNFLHCKKWEPNRNVLFLWYHTWSHVEPFSETLTPVSVIIALEIRPLEKIVIESILSPDHVNVSLVLWQSLGIKLYRSFREIRILH